MDEHSAQDRARIADALQLLRTELEEMISNLSGAAATVELDQGQQGRLSRIDAMQAQKMAQAQIRRAEVRMQRVTNILACSDEPDFGCCGDCGEPIPMPRLMARPDSVLCVECADARQG
mgnify:CR=1 FL=1